MLSVGAICFEDGFCAGKKGQKGGFNTGWLPWLAVEQPWSALAGQFLTLLAQIRVKTTQLLL